jgi:hypothetical protein
MSGIGARLRSPGAGKLGNLISIRKALTKLQGGIREMTKLRAQTSGSAAAVRSGQSRGHQRIGYLF